jgi:SPP1 family phage portal protein
MIPIVEYPLNDNRLGVVDICYYGFNALNSVGSNCLDSLEQFVQALLVFINCELPVKLDENNQPVLDAAGNQIKEVPQSGGAIDVKSTTPGLQADVKYLVEQLSQSDTQITKDDIRNALYEVFAVPSRNDRAGGGDTGQAVLLRDGWGPAEAAQKMDANIFDRSENECLKIQLHICRNSVKASSDIGELTLADIRIQHTRNRSANMATKASVLGNLLSCGVAPRIAYEACELFPDPLGAWEESKAWQDESGFFIESKMKVARRIDGVATPEDCDDTNQDVKPD